MNTFLENLYYELTDEKFRKQPSFYAFVLGLRFAFDLIGALYGEDQSPF